MTVRNVSPTLRLVRLVCAVGALLIAGACSSSSPTSPSSSSGTTGTTPTTSAGTASMSATIDGTAWTATSGVTAKLTNGILTVGGANATYNLAFAITPSGSGAYLIPGSALGSQAGNNALLLFTSNGVTTSSWAADFTKGSGTITLTSLTSTGVAGSFAFTLNAVAGTAATGAKSVTSGAFSINF